MTVVVKDRGWKRIQRSVKAIDGWRVTIGVHSEDAAHSGDMDNVGLAVIHEFGAKNIPERSFLRSSFDENVKTYERILAKMYGKIIDGTATPKQAVAVVGEKAVADVVNKINAGLQPPLKPATIARKGSSKPLIHTGQLKAAIKPKVSK